MGDFLGKAKSMGKGVLNAASDATEIGTLKAKIVSRKGNIKEEYQKIGEHIFKQREEIEADDTMKACFEEIDRLKAEILELESKIALVKGND